MWTLHVAGIDILLPWIFFVRAAAHVIRSPLRISAGQSPGDILTFLDGGRKFFLILLLQ